jgi:hypothetical protein
VACRNENVKAGIGDAGILDHLQKSHILMVVTDHNCSLLTAKSFLSWEDQDPPPTEH